jgi:hypothetical protein
MSRASAQHLLDEFNDGNWDEVGAYFDEDFQLFLNYLKKYGLDTQLNYNNIDDDYKNVLLLARLKENPEETLKFICDNLITDVYQMKDGYYLYLNDREELAKLFKSYSRELSPQDVAKGVLGEDFFEPFSDTTYDVYQDVIEYLNESNINHLAHYIVKNIGNQELSLDEYDEDLFYEFSEEQGTEGFFQITSQNVMELIKDESAMELMLKNNLTDLRHELYSVHYNAYNSAYTDEMYEAVWSELEEYFVSGSWEHVTKELSGGKKRTYEYIKIRDFKKDMYDFLVENEIPEWSSQYLDYYGDYIRTIENMMDEGRRDYLSFREPDNPDWDRVTKYINDVFGDYI